MTKRMGKVTLDGLDGAREREFELPDNWDDLTDTEREAIWRPVKDQLMDDTVSYSLEFECEDCELPTATCDCWDETEPWGVN